MSFYLPLIMLGCIILSLIVFCIYSDKIINENSKKIIYYTIGIFSMIGLIMIALVVRVACFDEDVRIHVLSRENIRNHTNLERTSV